MYRMQVWYFMTRVKACATIVNSASSNLNHINGQLILHDNYLSEGLQSFVRIYILWLKKELVHR